MITKHTKTHCTLHDGETEHAVAHDAFDWMKPHHAGGIHPAITEEHHGYLPIAPGEIDLSLCPVQPVTIEHPHPHLAGKTITVHYLPITAYLQAYYGPDKQIVTVPINGDAGAQRLHWLKRTPEERAEMKAILKCMNAWRLTEDGEMPGEGDRVVSGHVDHQAMTEAATKAPKKGKR